MYPVGWYNHMKFVEAAVASAKNNSQPVAM
jgi:hypothetical protein